jgi:ATP-dependent HslUV protease, peptidase subunit HslV
VSSASQYSVPRRRSTTILGVRRNGAVALAGDGQVTQGDIRLKGGARKVRTLSDGAVLVGFAGAVADALTLLGKFESQLRAWDGNLRRASVELAKEWRSDRYLRRLEAEILVADTESLLVISGTGDVIEPDDEVLSIGSGSPYAMAAAKALMQSTELSAREITERAMAIAADMCIFTNDHFTILEIAAGEGTATADGEDAPDAPGTPIDQMAPGPDPTGGQAAADDDEDDEDDHPGGGRHRTDDPDDDEEGDH